ncbi:MAG: ABC transporter ATP-binding protein [Oscillatoria sp. SIO1A7]|nr:ABC transporter ATP-binding protein [Oscillatoria sp. SIO1A7]
MKPRSSYWQLLPYLRAHWQTIARALACTLGFTCFWPMLVHLVGEMARFIGQGDVVAISQLATFAAFIFIIRGAVQYGQDALMAKAALDISLDLRQDTCDRLLRLNIGYFATAKTGDLSYRLTEDIDRIGETVNKIFHQFIPCILQLVVLLAYMISLNWQLTTATLLVAPAMAVLIGWCGEQLRIYSRRSQNRISDLSALVAELFSGIRIVQAFAAEEYALEKFRRSADRNRKARYSAERLKALQFPAIGFLEALSILLLFLLGGWQIREGNLTGTEFISYGAAAAWLIDPISITTSNYNEFKQTQASADRIFELLAMKPAVADRPNAIFMPRVKGLVEYRNVTFGYDSGEPVLQNLSLLARPGEAIALVGASGAGKTTLVNLLPRFYDVQEGEILIDGINIKDVTTPSLRRQIGIVPQETVLFSGTIAENIAFGRTNYDMEAVEAAAIAANAREFIAAMPDGYYTQVGERGMNLSGGQRQRIAIARAILLDPRILILDEATSALDSESENLIREALERLMRDRTVLIVAHRLATVRRAHSILVIEGGRIVEFGTHDELLAQKKRYAHFYAQQFY